MIKVYTKDNCMQCTFTKRKLDEMGLEYKELDALKASDELWEKYGVMSVPFVKVTEDNHWTGFRPDRIEEIANEVNNQ